MSRRRALMRDTLWNQGAQIARMASQFILLPFIYHRLGETETGILYLAISFTGYFGIFDSSFSQPLIKLVAEHRAKEDAARLRGAVRSVLKVFTGVGLFAAVFLAAVAFLGLGILHVPVGTDSAARATLLVAAAASLVSWPLTTYDNVLRGVQRYDLVSRVSLVVTVVSLGGQLLAVSRGLGAPGAMAAAMGSVIAGGFVSRILARRQVPEITKRGAEAKAEWPHLLKFSGALLLMGLSEMVIYQVDRVVIAGVTGVGAVTIYEFAARLHKVPRDLHTMTTSAAMPAASELDARGDQARLAELMVEGTRMTVAGVLPPTVTIIALAAPFLAAWGAPPESLAPTLVFVSYWLLNVNTGIAGVILAGKERLRFLLAYSYGVAALNLALSVALARRWGVSGVVAGTTISYAIGFPVFLVYSLRSVGLGVRAFARRAWWPAYPMAAVLCATLYEAGRALGQRPSLWAVLALGGGGCLAFFGVFWVFVFSPAEKDRLRELLRPQSAAEAEGDGDGDRNAVAEPGALAEEAGGR